MNHFVRNTACRPTASCKHPFPFSLTLLNLLLFPALFALAPADSVADPLATVDSTGSYRFDAGSMNDQLVDLYKPSGDTTITIGDGTGMADLTYLGLAPVDIYNGGDTPLASDPAGTTTIDGNLVINQRAGGNDARAVNVLIGNHTLTVNGNVTIESFSHAYTQSTPHNFWGEGIRTYGSTINLNGDVTLTNMDFTSDTAGRLWATGILVYSDGTMPSVITLGKADGSSTTHINGMVVSGGDDVGVAYGINTEGARSRITANGTTIIENLSATGNPSAYTEASGIAAFGGTMTFDGATVIQNITATGDTGLSAGVQVYPGTVVFNNALSIRDITADRFNAYSLYAVNDGGDAVIEAADAREIEGDIFARDGGRISAAFTQNAAYLSAFTDLDDASDIRLSFSSGTTWNVVPSNTVLADANGRYVSRLTNLTLDNADVYVGTTGQTFGNGTGFAATQMRLSDTDKPVELQTANLSGNGTFHLRTDLEQDISDSVRVTDTLSGTYALQVAASGNEPLVEKQTASYLARAEAAVGADASAFSLAGGKVDLGVYNYVLESSDRNGGLEWYLVRGTDAGGTPDYSPTADAVLAMAGTGAQNALYQNNLSDLRKRLGEVRDGVRDGLWASFTGWKDVLSGYAGSQFRQEAYSLSLGLDHAVNERWLVGANFRATLADQRTHGHNDRQASGDADSQGINLYATWTHENGAYADFVATIDRYGQEISTTMLDGQPVKGKYHNWGYGLSVEAGRKFDKLGADKTWFIEPQAQLSWYHVNGDSFSMDNGMRVKQDDSNNLTGRLGIVAGRDIALEGSRMGQYYLKAGINHEFMGDQKITLNGVVFDEDGIMGTRFYYGAGMDWELDRETRLYGQIEREEGSRYTKEIEIRVGLKHTF
ncbi:autotransporter outer membrane beta-barrel domain-containing protein [Oxalobacter sp. JAC-2022]|uniref:autotransporter family protein n=1 Tax=Oxalobacter aliiformigenes TaxID=2946593 RepID=UPI0022AF7B2C|nr:autotransporter outer membrane beta-barrel domain-containing protein [Oxalobacter aliiformigenes]MCZ4065903.1 autotransporter outer membrane beta-barrel domain-containing protein [Oxalobacter aliiformigenes]